jgi:hypothetical protein
MAVLLTAITARNGLRVVFLLELARGFMGLRDSRAMSITGFIQNMVIEAQYRTRARELSHHTVLIGLPTSMETKCATGAAMWATGDDKIESCE